MNILPQQKARPVVPILSLIDILAILLIFFVATSTFREKKTHLSVDLPQTKALSLSAASSERLELLVNSALEIYLGDEPLELKTLQSTLIEMKKENPELELELKADTSMPLGLLISIWDALSGAGIPIREVPARIEKQAAQ